MGKRTRQLVSGATSDDDNIAFHELPLREMRFLWRACAITSPKVLN